MSGIEPQPPPGASRGEEPEASGPASSAGAALPEGGTASPTAAGAAQPLDAGGATSPPAPPRADPAWVRALEEPVERFLGAFRLPLAAAFFVAAGALWIYALMLAAGLVLLGKTIL